MKEKKAPSSNTASFSENIFIPVVFCLSSVYTAILLKISAAINEIQTVPYIDEIYHVPQAQEYCKGNFLHWDNRITTLPGLYLISVGIITPFSKWFGEDLCKTNHLRFTNVVLSILNFFVYASISQKLHPNSQNVNKWKNLVSALNIAFFPPLFFFAFLYYTDVAAASLVFFMYYLHILGWNKCAAVVGVSAMVVRQTSVVWLILIGLGCIDLELQSQLLSATDCQHDSLSSWVQIKLIFKKFYRLTPASRKIHLIGHLTAKSLPYILVGLVFATFVFINNGLVVGDRSAHQATVNTPQLFYLFGLVVLFAAPHWIPYISPFFKACLKKWHWVVTSVTLIVLIVQYNTLVHPYLLADNRHYTFYIWKRVYEHLPFGRFVVIPLYIFGAYVTFQTMAKRKSFVFALAFMACCVIALVPQRLLEIRYFLIPYLFVRIHVVPRSWALLFLEFLMYAIINAVTLYLFFARPFYWPDSPLIQRFMW